MPKTRSRQTKQERLQALVHEYMIEHNVEVVNMNDVAAWAVEQGRYTRQPKSMQQ